jgi:hypothetical protein
MLMWEQLASTSTVDQQQTSGSATGATVITRLPYDTRCAAITKAGKRCRGRIRKETDFCPFHDPDLSAAMRSHNASKGGKQHHRLSHLPDGYLRKLTSRQAVGQAMDRLYRELRLGIVTPEMAGVLFDILSRLLESELWDGQESPVRARRTCRADRIAPKLRDLLTRAERQAWRKAVASAPAAFLRNRPTAKAVGSVARDVHSVEPMDVALPAAS